MGRRGAKYSEEVGAFADELMETPAPLGKLSWKKMFGGAGMFEAGVMFGLVDSAAALYLKAMGDDVDRFTAAGSGKHARMPYYRVPAAGLEDDVESLDWARRARDHSSEAS